MTIQRHITEATGNLILQDQITSHGISDGISEPSIRGKDRKRIYALAPNPIGQRLSYGALTALHL